MYIIIALNVNITMNPLLQKIYDETVAKRGGNLWLGDTGSNVPPMPMWDMPPMPMSDMPPMWDIPPLPVEAPIPMGEPTPDAMPMIEDTLSEAPVIMVDEIYMWIEDKVSALSPVETIELVTKILAMQIQ